MRRYKSRTDMFKIAPQITTLLKDYEGKPDKQRKIVERNNGALFYIFKPLEENTDARSMGES